MQSVDKSHSLCEDDKLDTIWNNDQAAIKPGEDFKLRLSSALTRKHEKMNQTLRITRNSRTNLHIG